ncbi:hypothetical protein [Desulfogranum japonicum]|uniref:hypothetical protein n=1 Tax=Desulfogranum japonicum TaxID=231447 RepID=UPI0003FF01AB|nr:hypothetical protein [Desulfogranum japonicum]
MQNLIIFSLVAVTIVYLVRHIMISIKTTLRGGCGGCGCQCSNEITCTFDDLKKSMDKKRPCKQ